MAATIAKLTSAPIQDGASKDWYATALEDRLRLQAGEPRRSFAWPPSRAEGSETQRAYSMLGMLRSFARNQGVPPHTVIRLARTNEVGTACAGFFDAPHSCRRPYILLDRKLLNRLAEADQTDAMIGLILHEAAHILYTVEGYLTPRRDRASKLWYFENLLEDYRIEELLAQASPGYVPYIEATKQVLLLDQWFGSAIERWTELADTARIMALIGSFVRAPEVFEDHPHLKTWKDLLGRNVFQELRRMLPQPPRTEADVLRMAKLLNDFYTNYFNRVISALAKSQQPLTEEICERLVRQREADYQEALYEKWRQTESERPAELGEWTIGELLHAVEQQGQVCEGFEDVVLQAVQRMESEEDLPAKDSGSQLPPNALEIPTRLLPNQVKQQLKIVAVEPAYFGAEAFARAKTRVASQVARLRSAFAYRVEVATQQRADTQGKLSARRLWRAPFDDRIFVQASPGEELPTTRLVVLLDASGSMGTANRYQRALDTAVLFFEALRNHANVRLQLYAHTSVKVAGHEKCLISVFPNRPAEIGSYVPSESNFDELAIAGVTAIENAGLAAGDKRILIVVSDGQPCDIRNLQAASLTPTIQAVEAARRQGWRVIGVGIGGYNVGKIYGERWTMSVSAVSELPDRMAEMLVRLFRQCGV